jgi:hypothetical protein
MYRVIICMSYGAILALSGCNQGLRDGGGSSASGASGEARFGSSKGEAWTILVVEASGPQRRDVTEAAAAALRRTQGVRPGDVRVEHGQESSRILYGRYYRQMQAGTLRKSVPPQMRNDLALIKDLGGQEGVLYFPNAEMMPLPTPSVGPEEWDLTKARGVYSLQVAAFYQAGEFNDRKGAAVEYARQLREKGYEAYYYHGGPKDTISIVTVGSFGPNAVRQLPRETRAVLDEEGRPIRTVIAGPTAASYSDEVVGLQQKEMFKYNLTNGHIVYSGKVPVPSALVPIPKPGPQP